MNSAQIEATPYDFIPADVAPATPARPRMLVLATSLASAAIAMGFMGLIGQYVAQRAGVIATGERWLPEGVVIPLTQPNYMGLTLAFSLITIWWSVSAVRNDDGPNAFIAFGISLVFGFAYIAQTAFLLTIMELEILASDRAVLIYGIIGTHLVLVICAMAFAVIMALRTLGGDYSARDYEGVLCSALFWTMTVALYGVMWYAIYITK